MKRVGSGEDRKPKERSQAEEKNLRIGEHAKLKPGRSEAESGRRGGGSNWKGGEGKWDGSTSVTLNNGVQMPIYGLGLSHNGGGVLKLIFL
jgi:hypothetical protein